jgi:hypothetical protein
MKIKDILIEINDSTKYVELIDNETYYSKEAIKFGITFLKNFGFNIKSIKQPLDFYTRLSRYDEYTKEEIEEELRIYLKKININNKYLIMNFMKSNELKFLNQNDFPIYKTGSIYTLLEVQKHLKDNYDKYAIINRERRTVELEKISNLKALSSFTNVHEFYGIDYQREFIGLLGPTNSGKTHDAIQALKESKNGIYLAPLRLLAHEIYQDLTNNGIKCTLRTGEEIIENEDDTHISSTIEMLDFSKTYDVAVIDEIQFLNSLDRGSSWTRAVYGLKAKKIFVIGSLISQQILEEMIIDRCKDKLTINKYQRLSELKVKEEHLVPKNFKLEKGDAFIAFSKRDIEKIKQFVLSKGKTVSIIYGALPPEIKVEEAERFNDGKTDILIATDAIGYGLNLSIKRIVYTKVHKSYNKQTYPLGAEEFKQISGRAGRFKKFDYGEVVYFNLFNESFYDSELDEFIYGYEYYQILVEQLEIFDNFKNAYFFPEIQHIQEFSRHVGLNIKTIIETYKKYFLDESKLLKLSVYDDMIKTASLIEEFIPQVPLEKKYKLLFTPLKFWQEELFVHFLKCYSAEENFSLDYVLAYSKKEEDIINNLILFKWLHFRTFNITEEDYIKATNNYDVIVRNMSSKLV